jgi:hypothetical protein
MDQHDPRLITMVAELDHDQRLATLRDARLPLPGVYEPLGWDHLAEGAPRSATSCGKVVTGASGSWEATRRGERRTPAVPGHISGTVA